MSQVIVIIPAFEPDKRLQELVHELKKDFKSFILVDDGSRSAAAPFNELRALDGVTVLAHDANRGKGAALKTAFTEFLRRYPNALGAVTVDADGQHLPKDVVRVADGLRQHPDRLTLGVRTFAKDTPFRSRLGNLWTLAEFRLLTGCRVLDTQTGLRGIPRTLVPDLLKISGDRYDYEIRMLVNAVIRSQGVVQIPIETVYEQGNRSSHYRPLADTFSTQRALFAEALTAQFCS